MIAVAERVDAGNLKNLPPNLTWEAKLSLGFTNKYSKTILSKRRHLGPLAVQRPFYPEKNGTCHLYILHPPGGVVGGDSLYTDVVCDSDTSALITTPAANKFYRSQGRTAKQLQSLKVERGAVLEWLPQETILFNGSKVYSKTIVDLNKDAEFIGWEIVSFGRPACNEEFSRGKFKQHYEIWRDSEPIFIDRANIENRAEVFRSDWGLGNKPVMGLLTAVANKYEQLEEAQKEIRILIQDVCNLSVTLIGKVLICRCLDAYATTIRECFIEIWTRIRSILLNKQACAPRIWAT